MLTPRISVIIPTLGRSTLQRAIDSASEADEILVDHNSDGDNGYAARERLIAKATGTHLAFIDDDDVFAPGAIGHFREAARTEPEKLCIFQMRYHHGGATLWYERNFRFGGFGTPCILVPNIPEKLGTWEPWGDANATTGGDFAFAHSCVENMGPPEWIEKVVAIIRPD